MPEPTTILIRCPCGVWFRWDPSMYRLCDDCLSDMERAKK